MITHKKVFICSPYRGDVRENTRRAEEYCRQAVQAGMLPIAPHLYFTRFLDDNETLERDAGISMGIELLSLCDFMYVYGTPTEGMKKEIATWVLLGKPEPVRCKEAE